MPPADDALPSEPATDPSGVPAGSAPGLPGPAPAVATPPLVVATTVGLALLVALSGLSGASLTAVALAFTGVVLAWGWPVLVDAPSPRSAAAVIGAGSIAIAASVGLTRADPHLRWVPVAVAVSVMAAFLNQLGRGGGRPRLAYGVAVSISALALAAAGAPLVALAAAAEGAPWVVVAMVALAAAALVELAGGLARRPAGGWLAAPVVVIAVLAAVCAALLLHGVPLLAAALLGFAVAAVSHALRRVLSVLPGAAAVQGQMAEGAASLLVVGVVAYLLARLYAG